VNEEDRKGIGVSMSDEPEVKKDLEERTQRRPVAVSRPPKEAENEETAEEAAADPLEVARNEAAANRDRWIRAVADLENFKKRSIQERSNLLKYRNEELLRDLLAVMDNMDRALKFCDPAEKSDPLKEGVCLVSGMFKDIFARYGVKEINAIGEPFDPHLHEAVARVPAGDNQHNMIVEELEKGYMYQDRLLRPSKVVVAVAQEQGDSQHGQAQ
jgi:molecular chaperone GrpE